MEESIKVSQELKELYKKETLIEVSNRSKNTISSYFVSFLVLVFLSKIHQVQFNLTVFTGILFIIVSIIKFYACAKTPVDGKTNFDLWNKILIFHTITGALSISFFVITAMESLGITAYSLMFLFYIAAMTAGATSSLTPILYLANAFKLILILPVIVWCLIQWTPETLSLAGIFLFFLLMLLMVSKKNSTWYWEGIANQDLVKKQSEKIESIFKIIQEKSSFLQNSSSDLADFSHDTSNSIVFLSGKSKTISSQSESISSNIVSITDTMEQTTENMNAIAAALEQMTATVVEISKNTQSANETTTDATEKANIAADNIKELQAGADAIGEITEMISSIADQTNLLALNATIEAVRAGDAGKGFVVVANEIKELASQSADSTSKITEKIMEMQKATETTAQSIHEILSVVNESNEMVSTIAVAVEEQSATTREISENTDMATKGIQGVNERIHHNSTTITEIHKDLNEISTSLESLNKNSMLLDDNVNELKEQATELNAITI